jgi:hypothetical protein
LSGGRGGGGCQWGEGSLPRAPSWGKRRRSGCVCQRIGKAADAPSRSGVRGATGTGSTAARSLPVPPLPSLPTSPPILDPVCASPWPPTAAHTPRRLPPPTPSLPIPPPPPPPPAALTAANCDWPFLPPSTCSFDCSSSLAASLCLLSACSLTAARRSFNRLGSAPLTCSRPVTCESGSRGGGTETGGHARTRRGVGGWVRGGEGGGGRGH